MATEQPIQFRGEPYETASLERALVAASYPFRGLWFLLRNPDLWPLFYGKLLRMSLSSLLILPVFFQYALLPQYVFLSAFHGPFAWFSALVLTSGEGLAIMQLIYGSYKLNICHADAFDATLLKLSQEGLVAPHRHLVNDAPNMLKKLGTNKTPARGQLWDLHAIIDATVILGSNVTPRLGLQLAIFLPIVLMPLAGAPVFIILAGIKLGKRSHDRWFQLRELSKEEEKQEVERRGWEYAWFGSVAFILELIPVLSFLFRLTNTVGSAMWAARLEEESKARREEMH